MRTHPGIQIRSWLILFASLNIPVPPMGAQESIKDIGLQGPPTFIEGSVKLQNGAPIRYTYYFDHSAVKGCVRAGNSLIVLTASGNLLRFDAESLRMTGQEIVRGRATTIALDDRERVLIGTENGKISEVDPATLQQQTIATAKGEIVWLAGVESKGLGRMIVATVRAGGVDEMIMWPGETSEHLRARLPHLMQGRGNVYPYYIAVYINGAQRSFSLPRRGGAPWLLEGSGRLWLGANAGEWGGACGYLDLLTGKEHTISRKMPGVEGFLRTQDRRMLVYGGYHGIDEGFVASIEGDRLKYIRKFETHMEPPAGPRLLPMWKTDRQSSIPQGVLELITSDLEGHGFWVLSDNILYHTHASFSEWSKPVDLEYGWDKHRIYSYERPLAKWLIFDNSRSGEMVVVMTHGGFVRISQGRSQPQPFTAQLGASRISDVWNTSIGTLFMENDDVHSSWLLDSRRWTELRLCSDRPPSDFGFWMFAEPFGDDGGILSFCGENTYPGGRSVMKVNPSGSVDFKSAWEDGSSQNDSAFLMTSAHETLRISENKVWIQEGAGWREAGQNTVPIDVGRSSVWVPRGRRFIDLGRVGQAELFFNVESGSFVRLARKADGTFTFAAMDDTTQAEPSGVFDAVPDGQGWFLAAAGPGLFRFRPEGGERQSIPSPQGSKEIISLCRDGQGRLWAASNDHVYLSSDEGAHWEMLDLPMLSYVYAFHIRPDPQNQNRIVLAIYDRGVVFLEW